MGDARTFRVELFDSLGNKLQEFDVKATCREAARRRVASVPGALKAIAAAARVHWRELYY